METLLNKTKTAAKVFHILSNGAISTASKVQKMHSAIARSSEHCDCTSAVTLTVLLTLLAVALASAIAASFFFVAKKRRVRKSIEHLEEVRLKRRCFYRRAISQHHQQTSASATSTPALSTATPATSSASSTESNASASTASSPDHHSVNETSGIVEGTIDATLIDY